jgi:hypothetical protein
MWLKGARNGDEYIFFNHKKKQFSGKAKVQKIRILNETGMVKEEIRDEDTDDLTVAEITFDSDLQDITTCSVWYPEGESWAINTSQTASGTMIKNCKFISCLRSSLLIKGSDVIIEENEFNGSPGGANAVSVSFTGDNITITKNKINGYIQTGIKIHAPELKGYNLINNINVSDNTIDMNNRFGSIDIQGISMNRVNNYKSDNNRIVMPEGLEKQDCSIANSTAERIGFKSFIYKVQEA